MDDSEQNNNCTQTKEQNQGHTVQQRHGIKTSQFALLHDICHLSCNEKNSNVVARLNLGGHHSTFNSSMTSTPNPRK
jgi:hypothetical protein